MLGVDLLDATDQGSGDGGNVEGRELREGGSQRGDVTRQCPSVSGYTARPNVQSGDPAEQCTRLCTCGSRRTEDRY